MKEIPEIMTERLHLRAYKPEDAEELVSIVNDKEIASTTIRIPFPYSHEDAEEWITLTQKKLVEDSEINWAITNRFSHRLVGTITLTLNNENNNAEFGYFIGKTYWGNGYCTEAAKAILKFAFEDLKLHRVHASHMKKNVASAKVLLNIGMNYEGTRWGHIKKWGEYEDIVLYGMLEEDWKRINRPSAFQSSSESNEI